MTLAVGPLFEPTAADLGVPCDDPPDVHGAAEALDGSDRFDPSEGRLRTMVSAHHGFVFRTVRRLGVPPADAEDATLQVFEVAHRRLGRLDPRAERTFLFRTAWRVAADARRAANRRIDRHHDTEAIDRAQDGAPNPEQDVSERQMRAILDAIVQSMPADLRAVFLLVELEEASAPEAASILGVPVGTVASRLRRARAWFDDAALRAQASLGSGGRHGR
jgi:RNA polymerase sigma-70 factor (ECF subfamily)